MDKNYILSHIEDFSAEQLFGIINQGIVTLEELKDTGNLDHSKRKAIVALQTKGEKEDDNAWEKARYGNETVLTDYITKFPTGKHVEDAKQNIDHLKHQRDEDQAQKREIIEKVRRNPNSFTPRRIKEFLKDGTLNRSDLANSGIPDAIIDRLDNVVSPQLHLGETPYSIPDGYTEVYFWGIPGSGKTCVLSGILSTAERKGYLEIAQGPGYDYMTRLKNIFINPISFLPPPSPTDNTQYLPFVLKKGNDAPRSVSLIELSGEIFQCFYHKNANKELPTQQHEETLNTLLRFLSGNNRKIHFFFVDYEKENNIDVDGYTQADYLQAAATYFHNNDIFSNSTDAIYIVITKSDLMPCEQSERVDNLKEYLLDANFTAFINSLKARCKEHSINAGKMLATHFSLGNVYFTQICTFNNETSKNIIDILIRRIAPNKKSILDVFNK
jgi:hypothetical protein